MIYSFFRGRPTLLLAVLLWGCHALSLSAAPTNAVPPATSKQPAADTQPLIPPTDRDKQEDVLKKFIDAADDTRIDEIIKAFKIPVKGTLAEKKEALYKYLGLIRDIKDGRKPLDVVVQDVFTSPDIKKNFVVYADAGVHIRSTKDPASGLITLYGDQGSLYIKFQKQVVSARLIRLDLSRKEVFGEGNAMMREGDRVIIGEKFYFNSETKHGVIYNANTFIKPYYYFGKKIKKIGEKDYILEDGWFTTCDDKHPHYKFGVSKCWLYQDVRLFAVDVTYSVSDFPVFWFPFIFHPMEGTGIWTGLGRDTRVGWFMQLVNLGPFFKLPMELYLDYYQRLGIAALAKKTFKGKNWNSTVGLGLALDKPLQLMGNSWVNTVYGDDIAGNESGSYGDWKRELRWKIEIDHTMNIPHDRANPKSGNTSLALKFNLMSDPFFKSDFESQRIKVIQLEKIFRQEEVTFFNQGSPQPRTWSFALNDNRGGSKLSVAGNWLYNPYLNPDSPNRFANDYYEYRKRQVTLPTVSYSFSGTILSSAPVPSVTTNSNRIVFTTNIFGMVSSNLVPVLTTNAVAAATNVGKGGLDILDTSGDLQGAKVKQKISYSLGYSAGIDFSVLKTYSDVNDTMTEKRYSRGLSISIPASFKIGEAFSTSLNLSIRDNEQWGETTTTNQYLANLAATMTTINESASLSLGHTFNKGLLSELGGSLAISHSMAARLSDLELDNDIYAGALRNNSLTFSASLSFFKTKITASSGFDMAVMKDDARDWGRDRFSDLSLNLTSNPFPFLSISDSFSYVIRTDQNRANTLSVGIKAPPFRLPFIQKVTVLTTSLSWYHSYTDARSSRLAFSLNLSMEINPLWTLSLNLSSLNKELYLYSESDAAAYGKETRSLVKDLLYSLMVWDPDKLRESKFNMQSFTCNLTHDLHQWLLKFSAGMSQRVNNNTTGRKFSYFDFSFVFSVSMKQNIGITFPDQRYRYTADSSGNYYGKYN